MKFRIGDKVKSTLGVWGDRTGIVVGVNKNHLPSVVTVTFEVEYGGTIEDQFYFTDLKLVD